MVLKHSIQLAILGVACLSAPVSMAQWRVAPSIGVGIEYDSNATMSPVPEFEETLEGYALDLDVDFTYKSELTDFSLKPRVRLDRYRDSTNFDTTDEFLRLRLDRAGQRSRFRVRGIFSNETVRTGELSDVDFDIDDPGEIPDDDAGRVFDSRDRRRAKLVPDWSYEIGERSTITLNASYLDVSYDSNPDNALTDFTASRFGARVSFDWTPRDTVGFETYVRNNDFDLNDRDVSGYGFGAGYRRELSETTRFESLVGVEVTERDTADDQSNAVGSVSLVRKLETGRLIATYRRAVNGSGAGVVSVRDLLEISGTRNLSERFSFSLGLRAYQTEAVEGDVTTFDERDYLQFRGRASWRATQVFTIELDYRHTRLDRREFVSEADSNRVGLWFIYNPIL